MPSPFTASVKTVPTKGFRGPDDLLVVADDWHAQLWLDGAHNIALYKKVWKALSESAVYGTDAHNLTRPADP